MKKAFLISIISVLFAGLLVFALVAAARTTRLTQTEELATQYMYIEEYNRDSIAALFSSYFNLTTLVYRNASAIFYSINGSLPVNPSTAALDTFVDGDLNAYTHANLNFTPSTTLSLTPFSASTHVYASNYSFALPAVQAIIVDVHAGILAAAVTSSGFPTADDPSNPVVHVIIRDTTDAAIIDESVPLSALETNDPFFISDGVNQIAVTFSLQELAIVSEGIALDFGTALQFSQSNKTASITTGSVTQRYYSGPIVLAEN